MQFDICHGSPRQATNRILLTLSDEAAADRVVAALEAEREHVFQGEPKARFFVRKADRSAPAPVVPEPEAAPASEPPPAEG